jgi:hypothetical protein
MISAPPTRALHATQGGSKEAQQPPIELLNDDPELPEPEYVDFA